MISKTKTNTNLFFKNLSINLKIIHFLMLYFIQSVLKESQSQIARKSGKMEVDLVKYQNELLESWKEVVDDKNETNWVLYTYAGQTYDLKVASKGGKWYGIVAKYR